MVEPSVNIENALSVSDLSNAIKAQFDAPTFRGVHVYGEISGYKLSGKHAYFTLKDKDAQLSCITFNAARGHVPKDGDSVLLYGSLDYYAKGGKLSFITISVTPIGQGLLFVEFEKLKAKLKAEGLFEEEHKKPIPVFAENILVVTSKTGAVIRDIVTTVRRKNPIVNITVRDVRVQGESAAHEIAGVLARVDGLGYDVIIIARGGGSLEDLAPFYSEELVRAVYAMQTPVVSAVGHETDFSLCDFVADARAATPTAAGELVAYDYYNMVSALKQEMARLKNGAVRAYKRASNRSQVAFGKLRATATTFYGKREMRLNNAIIAMKASVQKKFEKADTKTENLIGALDKLSPLKILSRGYFRIQSNGETVSKVASLHEGDNITATGGDGKIFATVTGVEIEEK